jgi:hypothetical protein
MQILDITGIIAKICYFLFADQDSVRLLAVEGCPALGKLLEPQDCVAHILPVIINFSQVCYSLHTYILKNFALHQLP